MVFLISKVKLVSSMEFSLKTTTMVFNVYYHLPSPDPLLSLSLNTHEASAPLATNLKGFGNRPTV
jgi:hypothetical protein